MDEASNPAGKRRKKPNRHNKDLGTRGEQAAARYLEQRGYDIVRRNWKCPAGEADIIAFDEGTLVFCEVKTRSSLKRGLPSEAVTPERRSRYERIAGYFLREFEGLDCPVRFDVISLLVAGPDRALIRHDLDAFGTW